MFVYLAHPIDQAHGTVSWFGDMIDTLKYRLSLCLIGAFTPGTAYSASLASNDHARFINDTNSHALFRADAVLAVLPAGVPTLGTPVEIESALMYNKPTVIVTDICSVQVAAWKDEGAQIIDLTDPGIKIPESDDLATMLRIRPRPDEEDLGLSDDRLLVAGRAANAQRGRYSGDAGIDLALAHDETLAPGECRKLSTGVRVAIPSGFFGWMTGRSSTWTKHRCDVRTAIIDHGYRGELMVQVENRGDSAVVFEAGTRLGQLILLPAWLGEIEQVEDNELPDHERGHNGYGSSGR